MLKRLMAKLALVCLAPIVGYARSGRDESYRNQRFLSCAELLSLVPCQIGVVIRQLFYKQTLAACGQNLMVCFGAMIVNPQTRIGNGVEMRPYCIVGLADIADNVSLAQRVSLLSGRHQHSGLTTEGSQIRQPPQRISIGRGVWVGAHAVVMADVGAASIIGAGAVVVHPIGPRCIAVGIPARAIRDLDRKGTGCE